MEGRLHPSKSKSANGDVWSESWSCDLELLLGELIGERPVRMDESLYGQFFVVYHNHHHHHHLTIHVDD